MTTGALEGLRVLEWCEGRAGAFCGKLLSDLGATVVKVEAPEGDPARPAPSFVYFNTGKQSVIRDGSASTRARIAQLLSEADVVLTDRPAGADGLGPLPARGIWCSITPFGLTGPYAGFKAHHLTIFHAGGEGHILPSGKGWELFPERPPLQLGSEIGHSDTATSAAVAVLAAVLRQRSTGRGERIDVSAQESQLTLNRTRLSRFNNDGIELRRDRSRYGAGGMLDCCDGRVQLVGVREEHWEALATSVDGAALAEAAARHAAAGDDPTEGRLAALVEWCRTLPKRDVVRILSEVGCPIGAYATPQDLVEDPQLAHRGFWQTVAVDDDATVPIPGSPYHLSVTPAVVRRAPRLGEGAGFGPSTTHAPGGEPMPATRPLEGIRIVDFTWAAAGPYATLLLAFLGAEVIKIESGRRLDPARRGFMADYGGVDRSPNFNELNLNKRDFQVNLTHPAGLDYVRRLIAVSSVVVDNFRPGVMARYGLDGASLLKEHPGLIVASSSANGGTGPDARGAGLASIFGATGGLSEQTGYSDGPPTEVGESTDYRSANALAFAILAALIHRQRTGEGQAIDLSSREVVIAGAPDGLLAHIFGIEHDVRIGNRHPVMSPHDLYPCRGVDEWIALAVETEEEWAALCGLLGEHKWPSAYRSGRDRAAARAVIDPVIVAWTSGLRAGEAFHILQRAGLASAPSFTNGQLSEDPHIAARGVFVDVDHPVIGRQKVMRAPWLLAGTDCSVVRHGPVLGQDNRFVIEDLLGMDFPDEGASSGLFE